MKKLLLILVAVTVCFAQQSFSNICPVCAKKHLESDVYPGVSSTTVVGCQPYYDKKGIYHYHECNDSTWSYRCSLGHEWQVVSHGFPCPAGDFNPGGSEVQVLSEKEVKPYEGPVTSVLKIGTGDTTSYISASFDGNIVLWQCSDDGQISLDPKIEKGEVVISARVCKDHKWTNARLRVKE